MSENQVKVTGDLYPKGHLALDNIDFNTTWVALCKIRSNPLGMPDTLARGKFFIRVFRIAAIETWYRDLIITVASNTGTADRVSLLTRGERNSAGMRVIMHKEGDYWVLYAKGSNSYDNISYQLQYALYPSYIEPIHEKKTVSVSAMSAYEVSTIVKPSDYNTVNVTTPGHCNIDTGSYHNVYEIDDDGTVHLNMGFYTDNAFPISSGTTIATVTKTPYLKNMMISIPWWRQDGSASGVCPGYIGSSGAIVAKGTIPVLVNFGINAHYKTQDNTIKY